MDYDGVTLSTTRVASDQESDALDAALGLKKIEFRVSEEAYALLNQLAIYNGRSLPYLLRTIIEQKLSL